MVGEFDFHGTQAADKRAAKADILPSRRGKALLLPALLDNEPMAVEPKKLLRNVTPFIVASQSGQRLPAIVKRQKMRRFPNVHGDRNAAGRLRSGGEADPIRIGLKAI